MAGAVGAAWGVGSRVWCGVTRLVGALLALAVVAAVLAMVAGDREMPSHNRYARIPMSSWGAFNAGRDCERNRFPKWCMKLERSTKGPTLLEANVHLYPDGRHRWEGACP